MNQLSIEPIHLKIVEQILKHYLPAHASVWVFGSRANGTPKKNSDLDLAIDAGAPLPRSTIIDMANAFDESALPYKVDLVDWFDMNESFQQRVRSQRITLKSQS